MRASKQRALSTRGRTNRCAQPSASGRTRPASQERRDSNDPRFGCGSRLTRVGWQRGRTGTRPGARRATSCMRGWIGCRALPGGA